MPKSDTIEAILSLNPTAKPDFLAEFSNEDLHDYLHRLTFGPGRFRGAEDSEPSSMRRSLKGRAAFQAVSDGAPTSEMPPRMTQRT